MRRGRGLDAGSRLTYTPLPRGRRARGTSLNGGVEAGGGQHDDIPRTLEYGAAPGGYRGRCHGSAALPGGALLGSGRERELAPGTLG